MKKLNLITGLLLVLLMLNFSSSYGHDADTIKNPKENPPKANQQNQTPEGKGKKMPGDDAPRTADPTRNLPAATEITEPTLQIVSILFFVVMLFLFYKIFLHLRTNRQFIGFQSIKLIGLVLIFPGICIIALIGGGLIGGSTLAALLGTIAGYVLSSDDDAKTEALKADNTKLKSDKDALKQKVDDLLSEIKTLQSQIPQQGN